MPLRLAGEDQTTVLGLDGRGWVREIKAPDNSPSLKLPDATTSGKGVQVGGGPAFYAVDSMTLMVDSAVRTGNIVGKDWPGSRIDLGNALTLKSSEQDIQLIPSGSGKIDLQKRVYNSGAGDGGAVAVADPLRVQGPIDAWDNLDSGAWQVALNPTDRAVWFKFKTSDQDPGNDGEGLLYLADVAGVRKLVAKIKAGGVVYTGALNLT
ncbi:MAG: hypothetical protein HY684_04550 [Chloroflexi bacterium]|nr:hypothetical protein [Chloroflexota bacterium]